MRSARQIGEPPPPDFKLCFEFIEARGDDKRRLVKALKLRQLAKRREQAFPDPKDRAKHGFRDVDCLDDVEDMDAPLKLLKITEHNSGGMHGHWPKRQGSADPAETSKMWRALCSIGDTDKRDHSGGSYGYGKAGFIRGSKIKAVIAYSCFTPHATEQDISRRLMGAVYWPRHALRDAKEQWQTFPGDGRFGNGRKPLQNDAADRVAGDLSLTVRGLRKKLSRGTTLLLVDPTVEPIDVAAAAERYWWPALVDRDLGFHIEVIDYDGQRVPLQYDDNADLQPFIDAYEVAVTQQDVDRDDMRKWTITNPRASSRDEVGGSLVLTSEVPGWSFPDDPWNHGSLVALVRYPRMVVEYRTFRSETAPFVRGVFVASDEIDAYLRDTEPKAHDTWITKATPGDVDNEAAKRAKYVLDQVREHLWAYKDELTPTTPDEPLQDLQYLDWLMRDLGLGGRGPANPRPPQRPRHLSIVPGPQLERIDQQRRVVGTATVKYNTDFPEYDALPLTSPIVVTLACKWRGDDAGFGSEYLPLNVKSVNLRNFSVDQNDGCPIVSGTLSKGQELKIGYESDCYSHDWTVQLEITAELEEDVDS